MKIYYTAYAFRFKALVYSYLLKKKATVNSYNTEVMNVCLSFVVQITTTLSDSQAVFNLELTSNIFKFPVLSQILSRDALTRLLPQHNSQKGKKQEGLKLYAYFINASTNRTFPLAVHWICFIFVWRMFIIISSRCKHLIVYNSKTKSTVPYFKYQTLHFEVADFKFVNGFYYRSIPRDVTGTATSCRIPIHATSNPTTGKNR